MNGCEEAQIYAEERKKLHPPLNCKKITLLLYTTLNYRSLTIPAVDIAKYDLEAKETTTQLKRDYRTLPW